MRITKVASFYSAYSESFYHERPHLAALSYAEQLTALLTDCFSWADFYDEPLRRLGYEPVEIVRDVEPLQRRWAAEHGLPGELSLEEITARQIEEHTPDVLWFEESSDTSLGILRRLEERRHRPPVVIGWSGSYLQDTKAFQYVDLTLSCAPESVEFLREQGARAEHLDHAFSPLVLARMRKKAIARDLSFFGQLQLSRGFHLLRAEVLHSVISQKKDVRVFSPSKPRWRARLSENARSFLQFFRKTAAYACARSLRIFGIAIPGAPARFPAFPRKNPSLPAVLRRRTFPGVFGLQMYEEIARSKIVLNIHADSSPRFASNMRLFEVTGVGSLLLTDWRENLGDLFLP